MTDYFYLCCGTIYLFICFTFRGIMTLCYCDLHGLFQSVMCPPYENWSNYWLSCPQQVKSVNGSIPILMNKKEQFSLWCFRKITLHSNSHFPLQQSFMVLKHLFLLAVHVLEMYNVSATSLCRLHHWSTAVFWKKDACLSMLTVVTAADTGWHWQWWPTFKEATHGQARLLSKHNRISNQQWFKQLTADWKMCHLPTFTRIMCFLNYFLVNFPLLLSNRSVLLWKNMCTHVVAAHLHINQCS